MNTVGIYARVSTSNHGQDVDMQLAELREYCERRGWEAIEYTDRGVSGSKDSRPALNALMADAHQLRFGAVICWKLDRLGRSLRHLVNVLAELESLNIAFVSVRDNLDLSTPSGRLMFQIIGAMAEFERSLTVERVRAGLAHARAKGRKLGRRERIWSAAEEMRVRQMRANGSSWRTIAAQVGCSVGALHARFASVDSVQ